MGGAAPELIFMFALGAGAGACLALALRPIRFWCPRCRRWAGDAWALGRHLVDCGRKDLN